MKRKYTHFTKEITGAYHNDKPLYWTMGLLISFFSIILLALIINS